MVGGQVNQPQWQTHPSSIAPPEDEEVIPSWGWFEIDSTGEKKWKVARAAKQPEEAKFVLDTVAKAWVKVAPVMTQEEKTVAKNAKAAKK